MQLAARQNVRRDLARLTSTIAAPASVASVSLLGVACYSSSSLAHGFVLGMLVAACATLPTTLYIEHLLRRGGRAKRSLSRPAERMAPLALACASVLVAALLVRAIQGSPDLETVLVTMLFVLGLALLTTPLNRVSVHMAAITGSTLIAQLLYGTIGVAALPIVALVGWSRVELGDHTVPQVVTGAGLGAIGASVAYSLVR
ncbi:MAG: hypothetical protein M3336_03200 [Chloroflexota bacterium]|nr:hypothetical protein [Chloroflexota bacterium]